MNMDELITANWKWLLKLTNQYYGIWESTGIDFDDAFDIVCNAVVVKFHSYNPEKGAFTTWASYVAKSALLQHRRSMHMVKRKIQLNECQIKGEMVTNGEDLLLDYIEQEERYEMREAIYEATLSARERELVTEWLKGRKSAHIARDMGITREGARRTLDRAKRKINRAWRRNHKEGANRNASSKG